VKSSRIVNRVEDARNMQKEGDDHREVSIDHQDAQHPVVHQGKDTA
jgi:hypothetical protein